MADNVTTQSATPATAPSGVTFATDDVAGIHHPLTKVEFGAPDTATPVEDAAGKRLPVKVGDALPAGANNIGDVDVLSLPALPAGGNVIGGVTMAAAAQVDGHSATVGAKADAAATDDTGAFSLLAFVKRLLQRVTTLIGQLPAALSAGGNLKVSLQESNATQAVSGTVSVSSLPGTTIAGQTAKTADFDTGAGTDTVAMLGIALPKAGGAVPGGTSTDPLRTDPTGTTTQPVSAASLPLPAGAATEATVGAINTATGAQADAEAAGNGSVIAILKRLRTLLNGGLPAALSALGNLKSTLNELNGTAIDTNSGNKSAGTQRVVLATDQPSVPVTPAAAQLLNKYGTGVTVTISLASLANGAGRIGDVVDNTAVRTDRALAFLRIKTGSAAPTANTPVKLYLVRRSNLGTDLADNALGTVDAAVTTEPTQAELLGSIIVPATANLTLEKSFIAYDLSAKYGLVVWNATGQALSTTAGDHILQVVPVTPERQ